MEESMFKQKWIMKNNMLVDLGKLSQHSFHALFWQNGGDWEDVGIISYIYAVATIKTPSISNQVTY